ncbi:Inner membrane protein YqjF [Usitatibacter rugosus]|uniref:Inner membrane protein YqjF n=1 Tax=Usitatibacter rugosus TaxID=2732067 RepID=A0A6M4GZA1_9PROT|nr:DoxX family protein [Usitatibacter rugosus]QJR12345.1 Inner membrane protein YqjF [Usitatibacter rugosus]
MNANVSNTAVLAGRILLGAIFMLSGFGKITGYEGTAGYMASKGMPMVNLLLPAAIAVELGGGLLLAIGLKARWAALAIFLFLIPTTLVFHAFWGIDPKEAATQQINFLKNLAIMGGMLMVFAHGPGRYSLDKS